MPPLPPSVTSVSSDLSERDLVERALASHCERIEILKNPKDFWELKNIKFLSNLVKVKKINLPV